jgi:putative addiction module component (TIGR02574 family)
MSAIPDQLLEAALRLPEDARIDLANRLFDSVESSDEDIELDAEWAAEIKRRIEDLESGREKAIPLEEAWKIIMDDSDAGDAD